MFKLKSGSKERGFHRRMTIASFSILGLLIGLVAPLWLTSQLRAARAHFDLPSHFQRGLAYRLSNKPDMAIAELTNAIRLDPQNAEAYANRGIAWREKKKYDLAVADFTKAIEIGGDDFFAYYHRGIAWDLKKEYDLAVADLTEAIRLKPGDARPNIARGDLFYRNKEFDKALADYDDVIRFGCREYRRRAAAWRAKGEEQKAIADENEARKYERN